MITKSTKAWVLHKQWSGETSAWVTFYTRETGVIRCVYKGGRTPKKHSLVQPFTALWLALEVRRDRHYVRTLEASEATLALQGAALFSGLYLNELLYYTLKPVYADTALFDAYSYTIEQLVRLKENKAIEALLRRFEWTLLKACGYSFSWTKEARTAASIRPDSFYRFVIGEGFVMDSQGINGGHILALANDELDDLACLKSAKYIMRKAVDDLLGGREIKARSLFVSGTKTTAKTDSSFA